MTDKAGIPLLAKLQRAPNPAWTPLLAEVDNAKRRYDPELQTSDYAVLGGNIPACLANSSGQSCTLSAEDAGKETAQEHSQRSGSYRGFSSGGAIRFDPDGGGKEKLADHVANAATYRTLASDGAIRFDDDGSSGKDKL